EDGIRDATVTGVQMCALPILAVNRDLVCDRLRPAARAIRVTDLFEEADGRVRDVARSFEVVVAAWREAERDHRDVRVDGLDCVEIGRASCRVRGSRAAGSAAQ